MKTRTRKTASAHKPREKSPDDDHTVNATSLQASVQDPPQIVILPRDASQNSRIVTVSTCDRKGQSSAIRYFVDPAQGFYEFTRIAVPKSSCKSWLLAPDQKGASRKGHDVDDQILARRPDGDSNLDAGNGGFILSSPDLLIATPIDPLFALLAVDGAVFPSIDEQGRSLFSNLDEKIWELKERAPQLRSLLESNHECALEIILRARIRTISEEDANGCDGTEYCARVPLIARELLRIAKRMVASGLPPSLEDRFVRQPLEIPEQTLKREDSTISIVISSESTSDSPEEPSSKAVGGQTEKKTANEEHAQAARADDQISDLLRTRVALDFLCTRYIRADLTKQLQAFFREENNQIDFGPLEQRLASIAKLKTEAQALRSISDNISRKRAAVEDEEAMEKLEAKKRKKEEEEAKKKSMSQGVKKLLKADTSGMKKLSSFFSKAAGTKPS